LAVSAVGFLASVMARMMPVRVLIRHSCGPSFRP
jgi:hypothetical protein